MKKALKKLKIPLALSFLVFIIIFKFDLIILFIPIIALIYGGTSENKIAALVLGSFPFILGLLYILLFLGALYTSDLPRLREVIFYWMSLAIIGSTIGYLAACKTRISLVLAVGFVILWSSVFYSGID